MFNTVFKGLPIVILLLVGLKKKSFMKKKDLKPHDGFRSS